MMTGQTISHYRVLEKLGEGGMGVVYRGEDVKLKRPVALKFLSSGNAGHYAIKARFTREAQAAACMEHPNICPVYGMEEEGGLLCIVMGLVEGPPFSQKLRAGLPLAEALQHGIEIGEGLRCAHDHGIIHRDIKASNILISRDNVAKITDFGLALQENRSRLTERGTLMGTINVMAPEQVMAEDADRRTDIWAFGVLLYETLGGRQPFERGSYEATMKAILREKPPEVTSLRPGLPQDLCWILDKALSKSRSERYQHVDDLVADLRSVAARLTPEQAAMMVGKARPTETPTQTLPSVKVEAVRGGLGWPLAAVALAICAAVVYFLIRMVR